MGKYILLFVSLLALSYSSEFVADVPLAVFSGSSHLTGQNIPVSTTMSITDVEDFLVSFFPDTPMQRETSLNMSPRQDHSQRW